MGNFYNIGSNINIKNIKVCNDLINIAKLKIDIGKNVKIKFVKDRPGHDKRYSIDSSLLKKEFNWKPLNSFEINLKNTILWYLKNQDWCKKSKF